MLKKHYYLVAGELFYINTAVEDAEIRTTRLNTTIICDKPCVPVKQLGKAQQGLQMLLFKRLGDDAANTQVVDVLLMGFSYLGEMTDAEFNADMAAPSIN